jgi:hypothetical protein
VENKNRQRRIDMAKFKGSYSELHGLPRVPRAVGGTFNGIQTGIGGNPPDKINISYGEPVDAGTAMARLHARKTGEIPVIPGGIDDEDPSLYIKHSTGLLDKMKVAQGKALTAEEVETLKSGAPSSEPEPVPESVRDPRAEVVHGNSERSFSVSSSPSPRLVVEERHGDPFSMGGRPGSEPEQMLGELPADSPDVIPAEEDEGFVPETDPVADPFVLAAANAIANQMRKPKPQPQPQVVFRDRVVQVPVEKTVEKVVEKPIDSPFTEWIKKRVKVHITLAEMMFMVSAVDVIRSAHGITVLMPTDDDSMTFIPKAGTKVWIACKAKEVDSVETIFTGVTFDIVELGVMGLAFLLPKEKSPTP